MRLASTLWPANASTPSPPGERPKIVLLHGMGGTGPLWRPVAAALEDRFTLLAPDQRGHGRSLIPSVPGGRGQPGYTPLDYGRDVVDTMEGMGFYPAWLLGHSMGVRSACAAAHLKPGWTLGLILVDLGFSGMAGGGLGEGLASFLRALPMEFPSRADARAFLERNCPDPSIANYLLAVATRLPGEGGNPDRLSFPFDKAALIQTIHAARDSSVRTWVVDLASHGMPILVLRGAESQVWSRAEFESERKLLASCPSVHFEEVDGAGHGLPFEKRTEFVKRVADFIQADPGSRGRARE